MVKGMQGHNWDHDIGDVCKKCGKIHHKKGPNYSSGPTGHNWDHGRGDPCRLCGKVHYRMTPETRAEFKRKLRVKMKAFYNTPEGKQMQKEKASKSFLGHNYDHGKGDVCKKCGKVHIGGMTGRTHTAEARKKISQKEMTPAGLQKLSDNMKKRRPFIKFSREDSDIEIILQNKLTSLGIPFEKQKSINGQPDIFIEPNICIFADGCYHHGCKIHLRGNYFKGQSVEQKRISDAKITLILQSQGYIVLRFWGHDIKHNLDFCINQILQEVKKCQYQKIVS